MTPWTLRQFLAALRAAGWVRMRGSQDTYISPDDPTLTFQPHRYRHGIGVLWVYFAGRHELPAPTRPPF